MNDRTDEKSALRAVLPDFIPHLYITGKSGDRRIAVGLWYVQKLHAAPIVTGKLAGQFWLPEGELRFMLGSTNCNMEMETIPCVRQDALAEKLFLTCEIGDEIPECAYGAVVDLMTQLPHKAEWYGVDA